MNAELAWTRDGCHLTYIDTAVEELTGWTAEEVIAKSLESLVSPASFEFLQQNYLVGPATSIVPRSFPIHLRHRDGHEICCRVVVVCRYDKSGDLAEAWGTLQHCREQCCLNKLLGWWLEAESLDLAAINELMELAAA